jgi:hypothetical protein
MINHTKYGPSQRPAINCVQKTKLFRLSKMPRCKAPENLRNETYFNVRRNGLPC